MYPVDYSGSPLRTQPQTPPAPPPDKSYTVQAHDTVASVAQAHGVTPQALAEANRIDANAALTPGQTLALPADAEVPVADPVPQQSSPAQRVDQATTTAAQANKALEAAKAQPPGSFDANHLAAYQQAATDAQTVLNKAVADEIGGQLSYVPSGVGISTGDMAKSYGNAILQRHQGDPAGQAAVRAALQDYDVQRTADAIASSDVVGPDVTPVDKLQLINSQLEGQPPEVVARVMAEPSVQQLLKKAAQWAAEPYAGVSDQDAKNNQQAALEASKRLAELTEGLPPAYAAQIVKDSMPTIQKIAGVDANYSGSPAFENLSRVVGALGNGSEAKALTTQIAQAYSTQFATWSGRFADPNGSIIKTAIGDGASPALALEMAAQLKAAGKTDEAGAVIRTVGRGVQDLQSTIKSDMKEYAEFTKDLNWLVKNAGPNLTPEQLQKAIKQYVDGKGPEWQAKLTELQDKIVEDVRALKTDTAQLEGLPDDMKSLAPDALDTLKDVLEDDTVQNAITFAANKDPGIFEGEEGGEFAAVLVELGHKGKDLVSTVAKAYIAGNVVPALSQLNPSDPASVARANQTLSEFQAKASKLLGIPQSEVDAGVAELRKIVNTLQTTKSIDEAVTNIHALDKLKGELGELKETTFSTASAGLAFRTIALGLSGAALLNQAKKTIDDPNAQNVIGTLAFSVGLAQDTAGFANTIKLLDSEGALGRWGVAGSTAGVLTEKFIGVLNIGYFAAGALQELGKNDPNAAIIAFDTAGATGAFLATFGEAVGLGTWAGPVGVAVMAIATAGVALVEWKVEQNEHTEAAEKFYKGAGIDEETAKTLAHDAVDESSNLRSNLDLSPEQVQELAEKHPEMFQAPGYAQAVLDVAKANGISGENVVAFVDAVAKDDPNYVDRFFTQLSNKDGVHTASHDKSLVDLVQNGYPTAAAFVREHSPQLFGADADARTAADAQYQTLTMRDAPNIGNLLKSNSSPAYQAELIKVMKDNGSLDSFVQQTATSYGYNGWPEAAKIAIQNAQGAGVLSAGEAQKYLSQLG